VLVKLKGYGHHAYESLQPITPESPFDLASLTKVVATTPAVMKLYESDQLSLDAPVTEYWPAFGSNGKERVTVRHLLTHTSGLRPFHHPVHLVPGNPFARLPLPYTPFYRLEMLERSDMYGFIARDTLQYTPGTEQVYSDLGMITMAHLVERITDRPLGDYLHEQLYDPLGMDDTGFRETGPRARVPQVVPTERDYSFRLRTMRGEVHDEAAYIMGGTSGHAGLFSTVQDLALYADMLIRSGQSQDTRFYRRETIDLFTRPVSPDRHTRALGWDTKSPDGYSSAGDLFGPESFGHTGFTGTSLWIDPEQELFVVLLTNRVHPNRFNRKHIEIRPKVADLAYRALRSATTTLAEAPTR
jgi:CubicO group peptidase (beta-lactamase class C family)